MRVAIKTEVVNGPEECIFLNCPFDIQYLQRYMPLATFAALHCYHFPRCALEEEDIRLRENVISDIIRDCHLGIHDVSPNRVGRRWFGGARLPRFNTPYELGRYREVRQYTQDGACRKMLIVTNVHQTYVPRYFSDLMGYDVRIYRNEASYVSRIRNWLEAHARIRGRQVNETTRILADYSAWRTEYMRRVRAFDMPGTGADITPTYDEIRRSMIELINRTRSP